MSRVVVVGSGASGVHFALTVLKKGHDVTMIDAGRDQRAAVMPEATFHDLKERLPDPVDYFLGPSFEGVVRPDLKEEYYGIPPNKQYVFRVPRDFQVKAAGFAPLFSFARGGLAQAWTAGCYPFNDAELAEFPFQYAGLGPYYDEVAHRIGITGAADDLARFMPMHDHLLPPLRLDRHSEVLLHTYARKRRRLNEDLGCYVGRTRVATLSADRDGGRHACAYLGRCLWGCPVDALYTPSHTLSECRQYPNFLYVADVQAQFFRVDAERRVRTLVVTPVEGGPPRELPVDRLVLAAGALSSTKIVLRSIYEETGEVMRLGGLMDNRQLLVPFLNFRMLGRPFRSDSYQYHLLGIGIAGAVPAEYVHGQITTLKTALMHPIIQRLPLDLRTATLLARATHAALGVVNVNLHDTRRPENHLTLAPDETGAFTRLAIQYAPAPTEPAAIRRAIRIVKRALWDLGCIVPPGMLHVRPMGASVHYAGTLPMTAAPGPWTTTPDGQSRAFANLYLVDGATFPFLPAKNITFTLMANAVRVAERAF